MVYYPDRTWRHMYRNNKLTTLIDFNVILPINIYEAIEFNNHVLFVTTSHKYMHMYTVIVETPYPIL